MVGELSTSLSAASSAVVPSPSDDSAPTCVSNTSYPNLVGVISDSVEVFDVVGCGGGGAAAEVANAATAAAAAAVLGRCQVTGVCCQAGFVDLGADFSPPLAADGVTATDFALAPPFFIASFFVLPPFFDTRGAGTFFFEAT
jgi:hypothetical protein